MQVRCLCALLLALLPLLAAVPIKDGTVSFTVNRPKCVENGRTPWGQLAALERWTVKEVASDGDDTGRLESFLGLVREIVDSSRAPLAVNDAKPSLVRVSGKLPTRRRESNEPWLVVDAPNHPLATFLPFFNEAALVVESRLGRPGALFPLTLGLMDADAANGTIVDYDMSTGHVRLRIDLLADSLVDPPHGVHFPSVFARITDQLQSVGSEETTPKIIRQVLRLAFDLPSMIARSVVTCIACFSVMAVGIPVIADLASGGMLAFCHHATDADADACNDMALGFVLLLALLLPFLLIAVLKTCNLAAATCQRTIDLVAGPALARFFLES